MSERQGCGSRREMADGRLVAKEDLVGVRLYLEMVGKWVKQK